MATASKEITEKKTLKEAEPYDPWKDMVSITLPRAGKGEEQSQFVGVNGRYFQVPKGKTQLVPRPVYQVLVSAQHAREEAEDRAQMAEIAGK